MSQGSCSCIGFAVKPPTCASYNRDVKAFQHRDSAPIDHVDRSENESTTILQLFIKQKTGGLQLLTCDDLCLIIIIYYITVLSFTVCVTLSHNTKLALITYGHQIHIPDQFAGL